MTRKRTGKPRGRPTKPRTYKRVQFSLTHDAATVVASWPAKTRSARVSALIVKDSTAKDNGDD